MVVSVSQIATYDQAKASLAPYLQGFRQHLVAGIVSALTFTTVSMPFDTVKTRVQQVRSLMPKPSVVCWGDRGRLCHGSWFSCGSSTYASRQPHLLTSVAFVVAGRVSPTGYRDLTAGEIPTCCKTGTEERFHVHEQHHTSYSCVLSLPQTRTPFANQEKSGNKPRYSGTFNALVTIAKTETLGSLWTGFPPYLLAKGTLTVILFLIKEQYTELAKWLCSGGLKTLVR